MGGVPVPREELAANPTQYGYVGNGRMSIPAAEWLALEEAFGADNVGTIRRRRQLGRHRRSDRGDHRRRIGWAAAGRPRRIGRSDDKRTKGAKHSSSPPHKAAPAQTSNAPASTGLPPPTRTKEYGHHTGKWLALEHHQAAPETR